MKVLVLCGRPHKDGTTNALDFDRNVYKKFIILTELLALFLKEC